MLLRYVKGRLLFIIAKTSDEPTLVFANMYNRNASNIDVVTSIYYLYIGKTSGD